MERYEDPNDPLNGPRFHTGQKCIERDCNNPAGTHWGRFWCQPCNAKRLRRISASLEKELAHLEGRHPIQMLLVSWLLPESPMSTRREEVECPSCKGRLALTQTASLGNGYGDCPTCGFFELRLTNKEGAKE